MTMEMDQALADQMVDRAIQTCADLKYQGDTQQAHHALQMGRCDICGTVSDCLIRQVGEYLGQMDRTVKAVYQYHPESLPLHPPADRPASSSRRSGINLISWVERKTPALTALGAGLEKGLSRSRERIHCSNATPACYILDIQMVEDRDVQENRGYGMFINNLSVRSGQVWKRAEPWSAPGPAGPEARNVRPVVDPEFSPEAVLFEQAAAIENRPGSEQGLYEHRLTEIKVALIRRLISDQLAYINIAKEWFSFADLADIYRRKVGYGRVGGKAAGMVLAGCILRETLDRAALSRIQIPDSYYIGSDLIYIFMAMNGLMHWNNQKYKPEEQIRSEYPQIREEFLGGQFPPEVLTELQAVLAELGGQPVIVRSSSLLEDNFGTSFAGKYESIFLPNQGSPADNLQALTSAIARIYSSTLKPDTLLYRRSKGLQDYDERMAILIQAVQGEVFGRYYLPLAAGVAFSQNLYRWAPQIRKQDGFARLVWGLGTRAVERVGNDYPRFVALSHPTLHPDDSPEAIQYYSQRYVDLIDLQEDCCKTLPVREALRPDYPPLRFVAQQIDEDGYLSRLHGRVRSADIPRLAITFDELLGRTAFVETLTRVLRTLEEHYRLPVDIEFTVSIPDPEGPRPKVRLALLQCRPQSVLAAAGTASFPTHLPPEEILFTTGFLVPQGYAPGIRHVVFVVPEQYYALPTQAKRNELRAIIARLNAALPRKSFICVGPGRWGTTNPDLGVFVSYSDIENSAALVELSGCGIGAEPEPSLGTHFFQDLMEAGIYPLAVCLDQKGASINQDFFYGTPNRLGVYLEAPPDLEACLRLIDVEDFYPGSHVDLVMDDDHDRAVAFRVPD